jgi:hypothetical protein
MLNATSSEVEVLSDSYGISVVFLLVSALGVVMSFMSAQLQETGVIDNMTDYLEVVNPGLFKRPTRARRAIRVFPIYF